MSLRSKSPLALSLIVSSLMPGCFGGDAAVESRPEVPAAPPGSLQARLDAKTADLARVAPAATLEVVEGGIDEVRRSGVADRAKGVGDRAPSFELPDATGRTVALGSLLAQGPVVVLWYRGGWCPYCNLTLAAYQEHLGEIRDLGATVVALTAETPDHAATTASADRVGFEVLSDSGLRVARAYGISYTVPAPVLAMLARHVDLAKHDGDASGELPLPATFVIDRGGTIAFAHVDADYRKRAEPSRVVAVLRALREDRAAIDELADRYATAREPGPVAVQGHSEGGAPASPAEPPAGLGAGSLVGRPLPATRFLDANGVVIDLKDWIGKKNVVLVIHRGFSGSVCMTCTSQTLAISRNLKAFTDLDARVFFLYPGTREGVGKFLAAVADARGTSESLPIDVLLDTELAVVRQLNIEGELAKPTTIIIDKKGVVRFEHVAPNIADRASVPTMLDVLGRLSGK